MLYILFLMPSDQKAGYHVVGLNAFFLAVGLEIVVIHRLGSVPDRPLVLLEYRIVGIQIMKQLC